MIDDEKDSFCIWSSGSIYKNETEFRPFPNALMTEYDYSPEAFEALIQKQEKISRWVDNTLDHRGEQRNPFTPATPAVLALGLRPPEDSDDDSDYPRRHRRHRGSKDDRRERNRDRDRDQHKDHQFSSRRHRSQSVDASATTRSTYKPRPPPLPIPAHPNAYPQQYYPPPKLISPRNSQHSSRTSTTAVQTSPTSYYLPQQIPYTSPVYNPLPPNYRAQSYPYPQDSKYPYSASPYYQSGGYPRQFETAVRPLSVFFLHSHTHPSIRTHPTCHTHTPTRQSSLLFSNVSFRVSKETSTITSSSNLSFNLHHTNGG